MNRYVVSLVLLFWSVAGICAERTTIDLGGGRSIAVPIPEGFRALGNVSPGYRAYSENLQPPSVVLLEVFLTDKDLSDVVAGYSYSRERGLKIESPRSAFGREIDGPAFEHAVASVRTTQAFPSETEKWINDFVANKPQQFAGSPPQASGTTLTGKFLDKPDAVGTTTCAFITKGTGPTKVCVAQVILHVSDRAVFLDVTAEVHSKADIDWAKATAISWESRIVAENPS
jgi:hypothetical protein